MFKLMKSKKGFTLVEVIVVLVILAILAAIMIPAMTGWIDKAKEKSVLVEARSVLLAAQTLASEQYAVADTADGYAAALTLEKVKGLSGIDKLTAFAYTMGTKGKVDGVVCTIDGKTCTYSAGAWTIG